MGGVVERERTRISASSRCGRRVPRLNFSVFFFCLSIDQNSSYNFENKSRRKNLCRPVLHSAHFELRVRVMRALVRKQTLVGWPHQAEMQLLRLFDYHRRLRLHSSRCMQSIFSSLNFCERRVRRLAAFTDSSPLANARNCDSRRTEARRLRRRPQPNVCGRRARARARAQLE